MVNNTLDEEFKKDMDSAPTIKSRIKAMKQVHDAGIRTTCFISPIFPGITDVFTIIEKNKRLLRLYMAWKLEFKRYI